MTAQAVLLSVVAANSVFVRLFSIKLGRIDSHKTNGCGQELWGELTGIDDRTDQERIFTIYKRDGSLLVVGDTGCERLVGPDHGLKQNPDFSGSDATVPRT